MYVPKITTKPVSSHVLVVLAAYSIYDTWPKVVGSIITVA